MRLIVAFVLAALAAVVFSRTAHADDAPKRSAELQVLDRFVGVWDLRVSVKVAGKKEETQEGVETRKWSRGGGFVLFENAAPPEFHMLLTYDPDTKKYPGVLMSGTSHLPVTATWDEQSQTMTFKGTYPDGGKLLSKHRFPDRDHAESFVTISNPEGKVVVELSHKQIRRKK